MIDLSRESIKMVAKKTGFIKDNVEKVMRLIDILEAIFSSKWKYKLALKGGTAINMFYMGMPRLSVDIDLDYIGENRETMLSDKREFGVYIKDSLTQKGYSLTDASKNYFGLDSYVFQFTNNAENRDLIKIEVNYLNRVHIFPLTHKTIDVLDYIGNTEIAVLNEYELFGSKFAALISRSKPRDVYDSFRMITSEIIADENKLRKCLIFYNCVGGKADILQFDRQKIEEITTLDYNRMLKPMLSKNEKFDNANAVKTIQRFLEELLVFTPEEISFVEDFRDKIYSPEKLFDNHDVALRVAWHPMAYWKCGKIDSEGQSV